MKKKAKNQNLDVNITTFSIKVDSNLLGKKSPLVLEKKASDKFMKQSIDNPWEYMLSRNLANRGG